MRLLLVALFVACALATTSRTQAKLDPSKIPGLTFTPNFDQYAGYITLPGGTKNIFYWFFSSQNAPTTDPVVLWLQGGPGCSDMGGGLFLENGPYYPSADFTSKTVELTDNYYSWNRNASVIYIDSPCGVGFSYGTNLPSDYETNDNITAIDSHMFLEGFFDIYTDFSSNDFWVTGESYAGVYIPTLANQILNNGSDTQLAANLKRGGLMLGNPVTNCDTSAYTGTANILEYDTRVNLYYWHGMTSRRNFDNWNSQGCNTATPPSVVQCLNLFRTISRGIGHLDQPLKRDQKTSVRADSKVDMSVEEPRFQPSASIDPDMLYYSFCTGNGTLDFDVAIVPDCFTLDDQVSTYLNDPAVQDAINAVPTDWTECTSKLRYKKLNMPMTSYLENFFSVAPEMSIYYYSGDIDLATVPFAQTQRCLETMNRPIVDEWRPFVVNKEVAGYVETYDTYTYATIKGAGHEAPQYQPAAAYLMFTTFLTNGTLPQ